MCYIFTAIDTRTRLNDNIKYNYRRRICSYIQCSHDKIRQTTLPVDRSPIIEKQTSRTVDNNIIIPYNVNCSETSNTNLAFRVDTRTSRW